jgi:hypothetical protein
VWRPLKKLKIDLPYDPAIPRLGIYLEEYESVYNKGICTPTTDERIKKMWYLYTVEFYSATKKNEILSFAGKWMEMENIILSEVRIRRPKISCSPSYADYRSKTNTTNMMGCLSH